MGQASVVMVAVLVGLVLGAVVLGGVAQALGRRGDHQRAADLAALAGARAMLEQRDGLFAPAADAARHVDKAAYLAAGRRAALETARRNGVEAVAVTFPEADPIAPTRIRVEVDEPLVGGVRAGTSAEAELVASADPAAFAAGDGIGEYRGPLAIRQGKPMRPDVALAFDRMAKAARADGIGLIVVSGFRSNAEQAVLFAAHPDPKWVAPPGQSLHRLGTELDLGPNAAYGWLAAKAPRFGFIKRYAWEPWHFGYTRNAGTRSVGFKARGRGGDGEGGGSLPAFVPAKYAKPIARAAQRWNVSAALLAAQIHQESGFNPFAVSPAGARGIAQFMPGTAAQYQLRDPFDPEASIDAQAHLMRDLLRQFGAIPLALAAYNAGPGTVAPCMCVPAIPETRAYVAAILGLLGGAGDAIGLGGLEVRLIE